MKTPIIPEVEHPDWYDGPVTAVVRMADGHDCLAALFAFDADSGTRVYGLLPIEQSDAEALRELRRNAPVSGAPERWASIAHEVRRLFDAYRGEVLVARTTVLDVGVPPEWTKLPFEPLRPWSGLVVDEAVKVDRIRYWDDLLDRLKGLNGDPSP
jgi:hypothetical protein